MTADLVNGTFELLASAFIFLSILKLRKDKEAKGIDWKTIAFFMCWGFWNLYFYPHIGLTLSFIGGIAVAITNAVYTGMLIYYSRRNRCKTS